MIKPYGAGEAMKKIQKTFRRILFEVIEMGLSSHRAARLFDHFMVGLIVLNVMAVMLDTIPALDAEYGPAFLGFEIFSLGIFTVEYLLRIWVAVEHRAQPEAPGKGRFRLKFMTSPLMVIDFIAIAPSLLFAVGVDLRLLRIFRLLRLFKLMRYSPALASLGSVLYAERRALLATLIIGLGLASFSATVMYNLERNVQPQAFGTIPDALWWALATLTTVGYGDVVPLTAWGRLFGGVVMIFGVCVYALPVGIIASGFANEIHQRDFVIRWGLVANVPLFKGLDAGVIRDIARNLSSRVVEKGYVAATKGSRADKMYLIVSGKVVQRNGGDSIVLEEGGFFGAKSLMEKTTYTANYVTASKCHLFILDGSEFHHLLDENPDLKQRIKDSYRQMPHEDFGQADLPEDI
ncbi:cyclic nucleotide-binding protein [Paremcibacter congregatus]|uniref:Cyclic nucleotide-binding protein n=2 Tax=Paremcibacter congregatus TaxID=2043170 RepID=A0A2G4YM27_9PROT|nr:cyclic nucleotide-binding protein [Paremcibacter congregatus]QDE28160.1 cyclic nucleotide-binding domain-containing protein [Paremcibacter congregatus]